MRLIKNKRGVELTMSTIIIAVLVIIVLIVLILIFNKSIKNFFLGTSGCLGKEGRTCEQDRCATGETNVFSGNPECESKNGAGSICCEKESSILGIDNNPS